MRNRRCVGAFVVGGLTFISSSFAVSRYVDVSNAAPAAPYTNWKMAAKAIQPAIDAAASGDEILVAPGTYLLASSAVTIPIAKTLTLRSTQSRAAIIDAQGLSRGLVISGTNSLVEGFTVRNGVSPDYGGGIAVFRPCTVRNCLVTSNQAHSAGGIMIYSEATYALVEDCAIASNLATAGQGGGMVLYANSYGRVNRCIITGNVASERGGGVWIDQGGTVSNCWVIGNRATTNEGGGIYMACSGTTNQAQVVNSAIAGNFAGKLGGGIHSFGPAGTLSSIVNCTIVSNQAGEDGGGAHAYRTRFVNDILYFNSAPTNVNLNAHDWEHSCIVSNCCTTSNYFWPCITNAPAFVDAGAGDFRLATASFCIDAGTTNGAPQTDIVGNPRPRQGKPGMLDTNCDMGAYEYGFHFNDIQSVSTNKVQFKWDVQDLGRYWLDVATNAAANPVHPVWDNVMVYSHPGMMPLGQFAVYTTTVTNPTPPMPSNAMFRLRVDRATLGKRRGR